VARIKVKPTTTYKDPSEGWGTGGNMANFQICVSCDNTTQATLVAGKLAQTETYKYGLEVNSEQVNLVGKQALVDEIVEIADAAGFPVVVETYLEGLDREEAERIGELDRIVSRQFKEDLKEREARVANAANVFSSIFAEEKRIGLLYTAGYGCGAQFTVAAVLEADERMEEMLEEAVFDRNGVCGNIKDCRELCNLITETFQDCGGGEIRAQDVLKNIASRFNVVATNIVKHDSITGEADEEVEAENTITAVMFDPTAAESNAAIWEKVIMETILAFNADLLVPPTQAH
jgi:hypothetical protein